MSGEPAAPADSIELTVNARHLAGPMTGTEVYMEQLLRALALTGRVRVAAVSWAPLEFDYPGFKVIVPSRRPDFPAGPVGALGAVLWKLWFDHWVCVRAPTSAEGMLYHGMDGFLPFGLRRGDRCVATVHDLGWKAHPELFSRKLRLMYGAQFPWVVRRADWFIAVSRYTADDLIRRTGVTASRVDVVYHGVDPAFATPAPGDPPAPADPPYLLAVGGVSPRKNTRRVIEAFSRWRARGGRRRDYTLRVSGTSVDPHFQREGAALPEGVSLLGYVDKAELRRQYTGAAALLYPSIYEGFGLPIIEAMACGTPVVTSRTASAPEIAGGAAILVDPFAVEDIEAGIEQVTQPNEASRLRVLGQERARRFQWSAAASQTLEIYRRLVG
jgi:glycosyltransferase involved in cell wall biosynthesis